MRVNAHNEDSRWGSKWMISLERERERERERYEYGRKIEGWRAGGIGKEEGERKERYACETTERKRGRKGSQEQQC